MPLARRKYAYAVFVGGQKKYGGTTTADTMEEAAKSLIQHNSRGSTLSIVKEPAVYRPCDGATVPQAKWMLDGREAHVCIWAAPEYLID